MSIRKRPQILQWTVDNDLGENSLSGVKGAALWAVCKCTRVCSVCVCSGECVCSHVCVCSGAVESVGAESAEDKD